jgi:DNA invertase Pin-like site-specific DNA recombinase
MEYAKSHTRRCAIYTRKSSEEGLEQDFNSLHAQREACEAFIKSQTGEGWRLIKTAYDDSGLSGGTMERPALQRLLEDIRRRLVDVVVVYKVDRLTRSLADFAKMVEVFDAHGVSFVSITQQFNTTTSMGRLTLNVLLSFTPALPPTVTCARTPSLLNWRVRVYTRFARSNCARCAANS